MKRVASALFFLLLTLVGSLAGCQHNDPQAVALLQKAQQAEQTVQAQGKVAVNMNRPDQEVVAVAEVKRWPNTSVTNFVEGPAKGLEIVRQGNRFWRVDAQGGVHQAAHWGLDLIPPVKELEAKYRLEVGPTLSVAGHPATEVVISGRHNARGSVVRLWIDNSTGMVLARTRESWDGRVLFSSRFLELKYGVPSSPPPQIAQLPPPGKEPPADAGPAGDLLTPSPEDTPPPAPSGSPPAPPPGNAVQPGGSAAPNAPWPVGGRRPGEGPGHPGAQLVTLDQLKQKLGYPISTPSYLPEGFHLRGALVGPYGQAGELLYTDGVRNFSITLAKRPADRQIPAGAEGAGHALIVHWPRRDVVVAAEGNLVYMVGGQLGNDLQQKIAASIP